MSVLGLFFMEQHTTIPQALALILQKQNLSQTQMQDVMRTIMSGQATDAQIGALLMGLRMKGESIDEIAAAAKVMKDLAVKLDVSDLPHVIDIVGTGGDGQNLFNVSTAAAFVISAGGASVAKHGNRGVSSNSGASDVLNKADICLDLDMEQTERCIRELGIGFLFAPNHHKAMKYAINPRKELAFRSIFNLLGPLTNPAGVQRFVIGVFNQSLCYPMAKVLQQLGAVHAMVVHSEDGLDEISLAANTFVVEYKDGTFKEWTICPEDVGIQKQDLTGLSVNDSDESLALIQSALSKKKSTIAEKAADMISLNAGAGLYVSGICTSFAQGVSFAQDIVSTGQALEKMSILSEFTRTIKQV